MESSIGSHDLVSDMLPFPAYLDLHAITAKDDSGIQYFQDHVTAYDRTLSLGQEMAYLKHLSQELRIPANRPKLYIPYTGLHCPKFDHLRYLDLINLKEVRESEFTASDNLVRTSYKLLFESNNVTIKKSVVGKYKPFRLLDLPREIRQEIMRLSWVSERHPLNILDDLKIGDHGLRKCNGFGHSSGKTFGILFANKMLHQEALAIGYGECRLELRAFHHTKVLWLCKALRDSPAWENVKRVSFHLTHLNGKSAAKQIIPHLRQMPRLRYVNIRMDPWSHWTSLGPVSVTRKLHATAYATSMDKVVDAATCFLCLRDKVNLSFSVVFRKMGSITQEISYSEFKADYNKDTSRSPIRTMKMIMFLKWQIALCFFDEEHDLKIREEIATNLLLMDVEPLWTQDWHYDISERDPETYEIPYQDGTIDGEPIYETYQ